MKTDEGRLAVRLSCRAFVSFLVLLLLIGSALILSNRGSLAWFSRNRESGVSGMQVEVEGLGVSAEYYAASPAGGEFLPLTDPESLFAGMMPGDSIAVKVVYRSHAEEDVTLSVRLALPKEGETPLELDGRYYYLSTQLKLVEKDVFLLAPPPDRLAYDVPAVPSDIALGDVAVPAGGEAFLLFTVMLVNYDDLDQSAYQGFGTAEVGGSCYRRIFAEAKK